MKNPNLISVEKTANETVDVDSFKKSVSLVECKGTRDKIGKIDIKGKCNSVLVDNCGFIELSCDSVMSTIEISNCQRIKLFMKDGAQVLSVTIDKTDGCQIHLSPETQANPDFQVVAAKSSEMNINLKHGDETVEKPLPEQFVFKIDTSGGAPKIKSSVSDLYS